MNKVIEFKAWHIDAKIMLYGTPKEVFQWVEDEQPVIPLQFTGLHDKNGKKIFEGDLLKGTSDVYIYGQITPVEFYNGSFVVTILYDSMHVQLYDCEKVYKPSAYPKDKDKCDWLEEFEIIGNIYENQNLCN